MSGTFERLIYDPKAYNVSLRQSTSPLKYVLDPIWANSPNPCFSGNVGLISRSGVSVSRTNPLIDVESNLRNLKIYNTKDPSKLYIPTCNCASGPKCKCNINYNLNHYPVCDIKTDWTRTSNPTDTLRGTGINRFIPLSLQPQDESRWLYPGEYNVCNRTLFKDSHVTKTPVLMNQTSALPPLARNSK